MAASREELRDMLSLEPAIRHNNLAEPLEALVPRIGLQYGGFRHVTEQRLKKEIAEADQQTQVQIQEDDSQEDEEAEKLAEEQKGTDEAIFAKRKEMAGFLGSAMQDTLMAVDFISLLETRTRPSAADTMSPALRAAGLPNGSLGHEKWQAQVDAKAVEQARLASLGRTMDNLSSAADVLIGAAERLRTDVQRETQYWKNILSVTERGWSVYRAPGRKTVALQFGANEAGPLFRGRGYAELVPDEDGSIGLVQNTPMKPKALRIRHQRNDVIIDSSARSVSYGDMESGEELELQIREARDSLFEEELFHEMAMEARGLAALGVKNRDGVLHLPVISTDDTAGGKEVLLIDLVSSDEQPQRMLDAGLAEPIRKFLQLLLCHTYRQRYQLRTSLPPALSEGKKPDRQSSMLAPTLTYLQHYSSLHALTRVLRKPLRILENAGLTTQLSCEENGHPTRTAGNGHSSSDVALLLAGLVQPLTTKVQVKISSGTDLTVSTTKLNFSIAIGTQLLTPTANNYGTEYILRALDMTDSITQATTNLPSPPQTPNDIATGTASIPQMPTIQTLTFDDLRDLALYVNETISKYLVTRLAQEYLTRNCITKRWTISANGSELKAEAGSNPDGNAMYVGADLDDERLLVYERNGWDGRSKNLAVWRSLDDKSLGLRTFEDVLEEICQPVQ